MYSYTGGEKGVNVGYIRCEQRQGILRFTLHVQDSRGIEGGRYKVYLYQVMEDRTPVGYILDEFVMNRYCGELHKQTRSNDVWNTGRQIEEFDGVVLYYDANHMYASKFSDVPIEVSRFVTRQEYQQKQMHDTSVATDSDKKEPVTETPAEELVSEESSGEEPETEYNTIEQAAMEQSSMEQTLIGQSTADKPSISPLTLRLMENRPKLPDFENHEIYDCVRIEPNDIGLLEMDNWRLGVNSFLTHGYYNYKYLMLGKLLFQDGDVKAVLGVPGVYDGKEQYIARIFGFEMFVPVKHTNVKTGNFGYWIVELV